MLGLIQTQLFFFRRRSQHVHFLQRQEEETEQTADPEENADDADDLGAEQTAVAAIKDTRALLGAAVDFGDVFFLCHETDPEDAKGAARAVHRRRFQRIVNLKLQEQFTSAVDDPRGDKAANDSSPRFGDGATGGDAD